MSKRKGRQGLSFQEQLERQITRSTAALVVGVLLFFTLLLTGYSIGYTRYENHQYNLELSERFQDTWEQFEAYLEDENSVGVMTSFLQGAISERNMSYYFHSYSHGKLVAEDLLLMDGNLNAAYCTFSPSGHLLFFCQEVCEKLRAGSEPYTTIYYMVPGGSRLLFARLLDDLGYAFLFLDGAAWERSLDRLPCDFVITDASGTVFTGNNDALIDALNNFHPGDRRSLRNDGQRYLVARTELSSGMLVYTLMTGRAWRAYYGIGFLCILILSMITFFSLLKTSRKVASRNSRSLGTIHTALSAIQSGNIDFRIRLNSGDEFQEIAEHINSMLGDISKLNQKNMELERLNNSAQVAELEARFHPHFIYNTLENIRFSVLMGDPVRADEMLRRLTALLRYSSDNSLQTVPLGDDTEKLRDYLEIMRFRHDGSFSYSLEIEDAVKSLPVPKLLVQPVVENSIKYGLRRKSSIHVQVAAKAEAGGLLITVRDNGTGIEPERLSQLQKDLAAPPPGQRISGLTGLSRRLCLMYGEGSGLSIDSRYMDQTCVTLRMKRGGALV